MYYSCPIPSFLSSIYLHSLALLRFPSLFFLLFSSIPQLSSHFISFSNFSFSFASPFFCFSLSLVNLQCCEVIIKWLSACTVYCNMNKLATVSWMVVFCTIWQCKAVIELRKKQWRGEGTTPKRWDFDVVYYMGVHNRCRGNPHPLVIWALKWSNTSLVVRLFPLPERGMNPYAQTLTEDEIEVCIFVVNLHRILYLLVWLYILSLKWQVMCPVLR